MQEKKRFFRLLSVLIILVTILTVMVCSLLVTDTKTRYIKREQDEIRAYYTDLYCDNTGDGSVVALENGVGYVNFEIMNYIGEDVTKRDITYNIKTIDKFYDLNGNEIAADKLATTDLHVKDLWGKPLPIGKDSYKYDVSITKNDGEKNQDIKTKAEYPYLFSYEEREESAVGKIHNVTVQLKRKSTDMAPGTTESVSLVIQLDKPYKEIYIVDIIVSNRLIVFSTTEVETFDIDMIDVQVQAFDIFGYNTSGNVNPGITPGITYTSRPFKVVLEWKNLIVNENDFKFIHNNQNGILGGLVDESTDGTDISRPFVQSFEQTGDSGIIVMYVPQSSNFDFSCLPTSEDACMIATVYVYNGKLSTDSTIPVGYTTYDQSNWGGYTELDITDLSATEATAGLTVIYHKHKPCPTCGKCTNTNFNISSANKCPGHSTE